MTIIPKEHPYSKLYTKEGTIFPKFSISELTYQNDMYQKSADSDIYYLHLYRIEQESN